MVIPPEIHPVPSFAEIVRLHPGMFFRDGIVTDQVLADQLLDCASSLGAQKAEIVKEAGWSIVGAETDWFTMTRITISETLNPPWSAPVPEWGQNCTRPEMLISLLAEAVFVKKGQVVSLVKGLNRLHEEPFHHIEMAKQWTRAIAFRGAKIEA